jgi:hypothetical protein
MKKSILAENRKYGWPSVETCPHPEMRAYIAAGRRAQLVGKTISHSSPEYRVYAEACEKRVASHGRAAEQRQLSIEDKFVKESGREPVINRTAIATPDNLDTLRRSLDALRIF